MQGANLIQTRGKEEEHKMNNSLLYNSFNEYIIQKNYIDVDVGGDLNASINGIPISISDELLYILRYQDFLSDGYEILKIENIKALDYSKTCQYFENIVKQEGALALLHQAPVVNISNWCKMFETLQLLNIIIIVDIGKEGCINVGKVKKVTNSTVSMLCFSPTGIWDSEEWEEPLSNISSVRFLNHYTSIFKKYLND